MKPFVGIVGGTGRMGLLFANFFKTKGYKVAISHQKIAKAAFIARKHGLVGMSNEKILDSCDVLFFSVPIERTVDVIKELAPLARPGSLLSDFTSIKEAPIRAMLKFSNRKVGVVGLHPLFGPNITSLKGQTIVFIPARKSRWTSWLRDIFEREGAIIRKTTAKAHDEAMVVVQCLTHFKTITMAHTMSKLQTNLKKSLKFTTPLYRREAEILKRVLSQKPELYAGIQMSNPHCLRAIAKLLSSEKKLYDIIKKKDIESFARFFNKSSKIL